MTAIINHSISTANGGFTNQQIDILRNSICRGSSDDEFQIFLMACAKTGLDPFMRQIYAVKRKMKKPDGSWGDSLSIQTGIDGYRLIAERTGCYAPGPQPSFTYDQYGKIESSTAYIKKMTKDGTWHEISACAYMEEYCQKGRDGQPTGMWGTMPRTMLAKCAEAIALRKAFPAEMSGIYTKEEMMQADVQPPEIPRVSVEQVEELSGILDACEPSYRSWVLDCLKRQHRINSLFELPIDLYDRLKSAALKRTIEKKEGSSDT